MAKVIEVQNLSKAYQLGSFGTGTISQDLERYWARLRGKEDPFLKIGEVNDRATKGTSGVVWSLKDINFEIEQGTAVGIIGRNGAGKSTLLKILSRTTAPTTGTIKMKGRVASLLEVGTGFHPELSGRDNIFLNGAILGMRKNEIKRKFAEIVDFSGVERYIDTPVKRYSSGMYVRLAFAVAAYLESEILIIDEVLAVGDAEFQKKCLGKMSEVSKGEGRTVLFVSHNMAAIQKLCSDAIYLENGLLRSLGKTSRIIDEYLSNNTAHQAAYYPELPPEHENAPCYVSEIWVEDTEGTPLNEIPVGASWRLRIRFKMNRAMPEFIIAIGIRSSLELDLRTCWAPKTDLGEGWYEALFVEDQIYYAPGSYSITVGLSASEKSLYYRENAAAISIAEVTTAALQNTIVRTTGVGLLLNPMRINIAPISPVEA
ncbi:ABC transporter ATP-binding protein [Mucilaginibacter pedocola]|uniref:ABC transporter n=1 Tax=Mucilaginibacter pedocola TaxID=1792845 RepID=A0A1S9PAR0_9SPHI|nr:ABC transporter ATP-binding protein [Mucilaginibacter pedocola]OOQ58066.1 ABC transporter [Mucilaginibacter pedocola]